MVETECNEYEFGQKIVAFLDILAFKKTFKTEKNELLKFLINAEKNYTSNGIDTYSAGYDLLLMSETDFNEEEAKKKTKSLS